MIWPNFNSLVVQLCCCHPHGLNVLVFAKVASRRRRHLLQPASQLTQIGSAFGEDESEVNYVCVSRGEADNFVASSPRWPISKLSGLFVNFVA